jgi:hypothetical protein
MFMDAGCMVLLRYLQLLTLLLKCNKIFLNYCTVDYHDHGDRNSTYDPDITAV